jgi:hypothetical protein
VGVAIDMGKLRAADVVVVKNCVDLSGHQAQAMTPQKWLGLVAPIG